MRPSAKRTLRSFFLALLLILLSGTIVACDKAPAVTSCGAAPAALTAAGDAAFFLQCCPTATPTPVPQASAVDPFQPMNVNQPLRSVVTDFDGTGSVPSIYPQKGKKALANAIDAMIAPGFGGMSLIVSTIGQNSYDPAVVLGTYTISPIAADPVLPALQSNPTSTNNPVQDKLNQKKTREANCTTLRTYYTALQRAHNGLPAIQHRVTQQVTNPLRKLNLPANEPATDLCGAFERASSWLAHAQGERWFLAVTDLLATTKAQCAGAYNFSGWHIRILWDPCGIDGTPAAVCINTAATLTHLFKQHGATDVKILDPAASDALGTNLFS